jgi:hypothetical protein
MKRSIAVSFCLLVFVVAGMAQKGFDTGKLWSDWTKDDIDKILNKSPWGHVLTNTDTGEMMATLGVQQTSDGSRNQAISWNYRIRFFSAKPIREAFAKQVLLSNPSLKPQQLDNFVNGDYSESIVVAVAFDSTDRRYLAEREKAFNLATTEQLASTVYLELKSGKHIPLAEYSPPAKDGTGAKFVFPRMNGSSPFISDEKEVLHLVINMGQGIGFDYRFKLADMTYGGKLEY